MFTNTASPHQLGQNSVQRVMIDVMLALLPGTIAYIGFFGWGVVVNVVLACITALASEALMLKLRDRPIKPFLADGSALVTALILAIAIPPVAPWWVIVVGTLFAIVVAKHLYGGLGYNPFNPAMVGYVVLLISFPLQMTTWPVVTAISNQYLGLGASLDIIFTGGPAGTIMDTVTGATPLDTLKTQLGLGRSLHEITIAPVFGVFGGKGWEAVTSGFLLGGLWLVYRKVISWHIPVAMLGSMALLALLFQLYNGEFYPSPIFHLFSGGAILGAFFIATDPVTAPVTLKGRLIFGAGVGVLVFVIRSWGGYPDAVAFAVLLMNMMTPTIDYYSRPPIFGEEK